MIIIELGHVFAQFHRYDTKMLLCDFNARVGREDIFKLTIGNKSSHEICNDNGVVNFATSKNSVVKIQYSLIVTSVNTPGLLRERRATRFTMS
jgi:hypothetical protein